jgi:HlyD family secretion protein
MKKYSMRAHPLVVTAVSVTVLIFVTWAVFGRRHTAEAEPVASESQTATSGESPSVQTCRPKPGGLQRTINVPATVMAFESSDLFAKLSGYLKTQSVDIGDQVHRGQILAEIESPEYVKARDQAVAALNQANAQVAQADARILTAEAEIAVATPNVKKADADVLRYAATRVFSEKQLKRMEELYALKSVDGQLVDEQQSQVKAACSAEDSAHAGVENAKAMVKSAEARTVQAKADEAAARANVEVAQATLARAAVFVDYLKIVAPFDGVVTKRNFFCGAYISSGDMQGLKPLLTIDRTDRVRVVFQIPDRDVPLVRLGSTAAVLIDSLPGVPLPGKVSRLASAEHSETRTMRAEIDLENDKRLLCHGMYGYVSIDLPCSAQALHIPLSAVVANSGSGTGTVHLVKNSVITSAKVRLGPDNGVETEVLEGLSPTDEVVTKQSAQLADGAVVKAVPTDYLPPHNSPRLAATPTAAGGTL